MEYINKKKREERKKNKNKKEKGSKIKNRRGRDLTTKMFQAPTKATSFLISTSGRGAAGITMKVWRRYTQVDVARYYEQKANTRGRLERSTSFS